MLNTLLEPPMVFLPQVSLIWHLVFMFFLPPPPIIHTSLNCSHFISPLFYTYTNSLPPFLLPPFPPNVSQPLPPYSHFCFFFILWLSPCYYHHLPLFDIQLHFSPPPSPWIAHPIPLPPPVPPNPPFSLFHHFMDQIHYYGLTVPQ